MLIRKYFLIFLSLIGLILLSGCIFEEQKKFSDQKSTIKENFEEVIPLELEKEISNISNKVSEKNESFVQPPPAEKKIEQKPQIEEDKVIVEQIPIPQLEQKNALKIYMLKIGERMNIENFALELKDIYMDNQEFYATYKIYYENKNIKEFEVEKTKCVKLKFQDGNEYIVRTIFPLEGKPNALQTQVYSTKSILRSTKNIEISENKESYILKGYFPEPKTEKNAKITIGQSLDTSDFKVYLYGIDSQTQYPKAEINILDNEGKEIKEIKLGLMQMIEVKLPDKRKYAVIINSIDVENAQVEIEIKKILSFSQP
ncbi:MAG: hypothetical protein QXG16_00310 [Candidatus Anstonellaceae archaeon]